MASLDTAHKAPLIVATAAGVSLGNEFNADADPDGVIEFGSFGPDGLPVIGVAAGSTVITVEGTGQYAGMSGTIEVEVTDAPLQVSLGPLQPK